MNMRMYGELATWWPLLSAPADYAEEAGIYRDVLLAANPNARTMLELGSGGGNNASHLKARFQMTLVEPSPAMRSVSQALNPECEHLDGDMRTVRLGRTFDTVFVHDAVMYMTSEDELLQAMQTAAVHCAPGGAVLFVPDMTRESFELETDHGGHDGSGRSMRYLEWSVDPDPSDTTFVTDFAFLLREEEGSVRVEHDRHVMGIFPCATWLRLLREGGFKPHYIASRDRKVSGEMFVGVREGD